MQVPETLDPYVPPAAPPVSAFQEASPDLGLEEFGNYYLLEKVAVGGMAELFKARQRGVHNFEKIVAIKRILPHLSDNDEFVRMFIDEAKLAAQLTHPNIVQIFDLGKAGGFYYIAMEFVDGRDLRSLLRKVREYKLPLPEAVAAAVTMKVANALDYAHRERGINDRELKLVHRDISPQNILISYDGAVKLVDFGIAKAATKSTQTMAGALKGKLLYMSPEQALGQHLDGRSDIYSLGLVLFELLTGERCFQADNELGVLEKVRLGKVQDVRQVNPSVSLEMASILDKVLQKNVEQRYASARLLERDLKALLVKRGNEPTEHDVAEYVNTLLKGTREDLETLLAAEFPPPAAPPPRETPKPAWPAPPVREPVPPPAAPLQRQPQPPQPLPQRPPDGALSYSKQPIWFIPAMAVLGLAAVALAWFILR
jgi:serine/threonine protein kinase